MTRLEFDGRRGPTLKIPMAGERLLTGASVARLPAQHPSAAGPHGRVPVLARPSPEPTFRPTFAQSATAFLGASTFFAALGGVVLSIRFWKVGIPVQEALVVVPYQKLVLAGVFGVAVPMLWTLFVLGLLAALLCAYLALERVRDDRRTPRKNFSRSLPHERRYAGGPSARVPRRRRRGGVLVVGGAED